MARQTPAAPTEVGITTGSDSRPPRPIRRPILVDLETEATGLRDEPEWTSRDRNSRTVAITDRMRIVLTALREGAELGSVETGDTLAVQALDGRLELSVEGMDVDLEAGQLATVEEPSAWRIRATTDALLLLTVALSAPSTTTRR